MQLNVWGGRLERQLLNLLKQEDADIICLQEAISLQGGHATSFFITVEELAKELEMHLSYAPVLGFSFSSHQAEFGNAILSKAPFTSEHTVFTRNQYTKDFNFETSDYNIRNLQHVTVEDRGRTLHVLTHHGHHVPAHKNGDEETMRQCKLIADYVSELQGPVILTGDFNLAPHSKSLEQINNIMRNLCIENDIKTTRTHLTHKTEVCDFVFINDGVVPEEFKVLDDLASDHCALTLRFILG